MKSSVLAFATALAVAAPAAADAATFAPPNSTVTFQGTLALSHGATEYCPTTMVIQTDATGTAATVVSFTMTGASWCPLYDIVTPTALAVPGTGLVSIPNFQFLLGGTPCGPSTNTVLDWNGAFQEIKFYLDYIAPGSACYMRVDGSLYLSSGPTLTIAP